MQSILRAPQNGDKKKGKNGNKMKRNCILGAIIICTNGVRLHNAVRQINVRAPKARQA